MSENPFSSKPTIVDEVEQEDEQDGTDGPDPMNPGGVKADYGDRVPPTGNEVEDEEGEADEEWAQTPTEMFATMEQEKFWWVFVTLKDEFAESGDRRGIPVVEERFDSYDDLVDARGDTDKEIPEGIHVQLKKSSKVRYVKDEDEDNLLEGRDLA